jgi:molybdopterin-guanine dinucleotide biosynthesis protein A
LQILAPENAAQADSIAGFILVGGASRRMGTDKAGLLLSGKSFIDRIAAALAPIASPVTLVGKEPESAASKLATIPDVYGKWGALGGVHAALSACNSEWTAVVACDLPFVTAPLFAYLAGLRDHFEAVVPIQEDNLPQPLCALYRTAVCLDRAEQLIKAGERRPIALLQSVRTRWVPFAALADLEGVEDFFANINTPEDYALARQKGG